MKALRLSALGGVVLIAIVAPRMATMPTLILMLAAGVVVPLGLALDEAPPVFCYLAPFGVAGGVLTWMFAPGTALAIGLVALHDIVCAGAGLLAVSRLLPALRARKLPPLPDIASNVGLLFLPPAAAWLTASRAGVPLAGFQEPVVTFTAAHFHFAGFAAPTILGALGPRLTKHDVIYRIALVAVCAGVPLTAIGIATNHIVEQISAITVATGMLAASATLIRFRAPSPLARALFVASGATLLLTMTLAATFALTSSAGRGSSLNGAPGNPGDGRSAVELETMIRYHGAANAIGFALAALGALTLTPRPLRSSTPNR